MSIVVSHTCDLSTREVEAGGLQGTQRQLGLHSESQVSLGYGVRYYYNNNKTKIE